MIVNCELWAFKNGEVREVDMKALAFDEEPEPELVQEVLSDVFYWGQNENQRFHPQNHLPSVSMGDVALLWGKKYLCCSVGWNELTQEEYEAFTSLPQRDRSLFFLQVNPGSLTKPA